MFKYADKIGGGYLWVLYDFEDILCAWCHTYSLSVIINEIVTTEIRTTKPVHARTLL